MRIGILTHHYINNYGAFLQAWALRETVASLFPEAEVEIIDYVNLKHYIINAAGWFRFNRGKESVSCWKEKIKVPSTFSKARREKMILSQRCYSVKKINEFKYDYIIVGSDEVWNYKDKKSNHPMKFGKGLMCKNIIAYAPSVGETIVDDSLPKYVRNGIPKFQALSARDELTQNLVERITDVRPIRVLDPTFLSDFPSQKSHEKKHFILFYYCDKLPKKIKKQILDYAHIRGLNVYGAGECDKEFTDITVNISPFEWVDMFREADFVFTGTFHGVVFSILNKRQFYVYLTKDSRVKKVNDLLNEFSIKNRGIHSNFELKPNMESIDYDTVYSKIEKEINESKAYIINAIQL